MGLDPLSHLEPGTSPFDVIMSLDDTIMLARRALGTQLKALSYDAIRDGSEASLTLGMQLLWDARDAFVASVEEQAT